MKVLLVNPGREESTLKGNLNARAAAPPLGLLYVASNLLKHGNEVKVVDQSGNMMPDDALISLAKSYDPDLIGFSVMAGQLSSAGRLTIKLKASLPNTKILWGGVAPTFTARRIMIKYRGADFCIKGEGEESIIKLLKAMKSKAYDKVHGLVYRFGKRIKESTPRVLVKNLDSLPFPNRDLVKDVEYGSLSGLHLKGFTTLLSSRGCPYTCKYCCCSALVNRHWRARSINNVLDELELVQNSGYSSVLFADDGLTLNNKRVRELSRGIRKRSIKLNWFFEGRVDNANKETFKEMVKAGAKICYFGAESANNRVLRLYDKHINPYQTRMAVKAARKAGMDFVVASFILGAPGETKTEVERTIKFMTELDVDFVQVTDLVAYPGTRLWDELVSQGYIDPDKYWESGVDVGSVHPKSLGNKYLKQKVKEAYSRFVANPKVKLKHILRLLKSRFRQKVFWHNIKYFDKNLIYRLIGG